MLGDLVEYNGIMAGVSKHCFRTNRGHQLGPRKVTMAGDWLASRRGIEYRASGDKVGRQSGLLNR